MSQMHQDKVQRCLGNDLQPDEQVRHAVLAFHVGGVRQTMAAGGSAIAGGVGRAVGTAVSPSSPGAAHPHELPIPHRCFIALTTRRLLVLTVGGFFVAAPKQVVHDLPFDQIISVGQPSIDGNLAKALRITLGLADGGVLRWEFPRIQIKDGTALVNELRQHLHQP